MDHTIKIKGLKQGIESKTRRVYGLLEIGDGLSSSTSETVIASPDGRDAQLVRIRRTKKKPLNIEHTRNTYLLTQRQRSRHEPFRLAVSRYSKPYSGRHSTLLKPPHHHHKTPSSVNVNPHLNHQFSQGQFPSTIGEREHNDCGVGVITVGRMT
ncbi:hypothetical protein V8G54_022947 [Vigna mungo]|uniref:Uncharacterized protein n=1 Tax=Vigna mungo TaxID=3915 RepID=A0AAQ3N3S4_VIGMU